MRWVPTLLTSLCSLYILWQVGLQQQLLVDVAALKADSEMFKHDWEHESPLLPGLSPQEALNKVTHYQQTVLLRWARFEFCAAGEALFGLPQTPMPQLAMLLRDIKDMHEFYSLYVDYSVEAEKFSALTWKETQEHLASLISQVALYQKQLAPVTEKPIMDGFAAVLACRTSTEHISGSLVLVESLTKTSVRPR